ncbi:hypothetical protein BJ165DRAFT_1310808, partial [Panaeolus papilionaceus]
NETLVLRGFLGATPEQPSLAFGLDLLEVYQQLRRVCPRLSLDALARALCHIHHHPIQPYLADQLSCAYDCFIEMQTHIHHLHDQALQRSPEWTQKNVCAPCLYKTDNEPNLRFSFLAAMDGNNSLKLVDSTFRAGTACADDRESKSLQWISPEGVNVFKDEVSKKVSLEDVAWLNVAEMDELAKCVNTCVERWKNAGPEARKKMFALFTVAGIFIAVCRHGHVLVVCDMIRSGELMKYPLAVINCLFESYSSDICLGYDIMCAFYKT